MLFKRKPDQSQSISGSQINGAQIQHGQAAGDLTQTQQGNQTDQQNQGLNAADVVTILGQVEATIRGAGLPAASQDKAIAQQEAAEPAPDKDLMAKNLKRMGDILSTANETVTAGKTLWQTVQPMLLPVLGWLGVAAGLLGL